MRFDEVLGISMNLENVPESLRKFEGERAICAVGP